MLRLAWRGVLAHKFRLARTGFAIVLGVAFVAGSFVFTDSIRSAFDDLFNEVNADVDLYVRGTNAFGSDSGRVPEEIVDQIREIDGIEILSPSVEGFAQLVDLDGDPIGGSGPPTFGFSFDPAGEELSPLQLDSGRWPTAPGEVVVDAFAADANDLSVGDTIDIIFTVGVEPYEIVGIASFGDADNLLGATLAVFEEETAQRVFDSEGFYASISIVSSSGVDPAGLAAQIGTLLPDNVEVVTGAQQTQDELDEIDEGFLSFITTALLVFAGVAVFVGAFIIQNTFRIIVAQRTRELALLRAVGATGSQVILMVVLEALLVGLIASAIGIGVGVLIAIGIRALFDAIGFGVPAGALAVLPRTVIVGMIVGIVVTLVSAIIPARKAARVAPIAALRGLEARPSRALTRRAVAGAAVTGAGAVLLLLGLFAGAGIALVGFGAAVVFIGVSVLAPLGARTFASVVGRPLPRFLGVVGRMAQENAVRKPRRTAATASALTIGVALVAVIAVLATSLKASVASSLREDFNADYQVQVSGFADPLQTGLSAQLHFDLEELPELETVARMRIGEFREAGELTQEFLLGVDRDIEVMVNLDVTEGSLQDLGVGSVLLSTSRAEEEGVGLGDVFSIEVPSGEVTEFEIAALFENSDALGVPVLLAMEDFEALYTFGLDRMLLIEVAEGVDLGAARTAIEDVAAPFPNATVSNEQEFIETTEEQIDALLNLINGLLAMAILIALLGITNTLALSIFERRREIGLLRAVGTSRRQVRRMIRWESVLIAMFGAVLGLIVGVILGIAVVSAIGQGITLAMPWSQLVIYLVAAAVGGILASIGPARRAAKMNVLEAISYE